MNSKSKDVNHYFIWSKYVPNHCLNTRCYCLDCTRVYLNGQTTANESKARLQRGSKKIYKPQRATERIPVDLRPNDSVMRNAGPLIILHVRSSGHKALSMKLTKGYEYIHAAIGEANLSDEEVSQLQDLLDSVNFDGGIRTYSGIMEVLSTWSNPSHMRVFSNMVIFFLAGPSDDYEQWMNDGKGEKVKECIRDDRIRAQLLKKLMNMFSQLGV